MPAMVRRRLPWFVPVLLALCVAAPTARPQQVPASQALPDGLVSDVDDLSLVETLVLPLLDPAGLLKEDLAAAEQGGPFRYAVPRDVSITPATQGSWQALPDGRMLWRYVVSAPDARSLSFGFGAFRLPDGATLWIYAPDGSRSIRPFTAADHDAHGQLWTPVLLGDTAVIELAVRPGALDELDLVLTRIGHGYRGFGTKSIYEGYASGSCNVDVVCPQGDDWPLEIASVGAYQIGSTWICSGALVNDTADSLTPYFLTAAHCGVSPGNAPSVVVYWNYENSFCRTPGSAASGGPGDGMLTQFSSGAVYRAGYSPSDFTLIEMDDDPDPAWDVGYSGWDRSGVDAASAVAIHHPGVQEKRISFEFQPTTVTSYLGNPVPGDATHVRVEDWDIGTTEGGSSGSPLYDQDHRIIGQLHGGFASCSSQTSDWYGRFAVSWDGGGSPSTRLSDWLDPGATGAVTVDSISLNTLCDEQGTVTLGSGGLAGGAGALVEVVDCDLNTNDLVVETTSITVSSVANPGGVSVLLTESGASTGRFVGSVVVCGGALGVTTGDTVTATYIDADDGLGGSNVVVTADALVDCTPALLGSVAVTGVTANQATISFSASEPVTGAVLLGTSCGSLTEVATGAGATTMVSLDVTGLSDDTTYVFAVQGVDVAGNVSTADNGGVCFGFTTPPAPEYYTEQFTGDHDLDNTQLLFEPVGGADFYSACVERTTGLPVDPGAGTPLVLSDDDSEQVALSGGKRVLLYGSAYPSVWVGSNGYVTLGGADTDYDESLAEHFSLPRIAALYDDLNPSSGGTVSTQQLADRFVVTWLGVPEFSTSNSNTMQVELFFDGRVRLTLLGIDATDGIVGLSRGTGLQGDFFEEDLSGMSGCGAEICQADLGFGGPGSTVLTMCGGDLSSGTTADVLLQGAVPGGTAWLVLGAMNAPTPFKGGLLVPVPVLSAQPFPVSGSGQVSIASVPGGFGPLSVYLQFASTDAGQVAGFALSNALRADFLP